MSVTYSISHPTRLVIAVAKDRVSTADVLNYLMEVNEAGAQPYRKIFDMTGAKGTIPLVELRLRIPVLSSRPTSPARTARSNRVSSAPGTIPRPFRQRRGQNSRRPRRSQCRPASVIAPAD